MVAASANTTYDCYTSTLSCMGYQHFKSCAHCKSPRVTLCGALVRQIHNNICRQENASKTNCKKVIAREKR
eukprot:3591776-Amphidinium_carterae.1